MLHRLEEAGYEEGVQHGRLEGRASGFITGQTKGTELGEEVNSFNIHLSIKTIMRYFNAYRLVIIWVSLKLCLKSIWKECKAMSN